MFTILQKKITRDSTIAALESDHRICPYCDNEFYSREAKFCPKCGGELDIAGVHEPQHKVKGGLPKQPITKVFPMTPLGILNRITVGALLLAIAPLPYSYYIILRWVILISSLIHFYFAFNRKSKSVMVIFAALGILFNPIVPIYLSKGIWTILDFLSAIFALMGLEELEGISPTSDNKK